MNKILKILPFLLFSQLAFSQSTDLNFIDYNQVLLDIKNKGKESKYYQNLDYKSMLYLDKKCFIELAALNPNFLKEENIDTLRLFSSIPETFINYNQDVKYFKSEINNLKEFFLNTNEFEAINNEFFGVTHELKYKLWPKIYIKDNLKAIYTIYGKSYSETYRISLLDKKLKVEYLYSIME